MLSQVLSGLTLVRHAVAITLVMGAAGATVAGAVDASHASTVTTTTVVSTTANTTQNDTKDLEAAPPSAKPEHTNTRELIGLVTACVASHERSSEPCAKALALSGLSADEFWAKVGAMFDNKKNEPTSSPKTTAGLTAIIGACLEKFEAAKKGAYTEPIVNTEACKKAFEATGLTPEQFYAKFVQKRAATEKPRTTQRMSDADLAALVKDCFARYTAATAAKGNEDLAHAAYEACTKAMTASGLTGDAFWAKFGTPQAPKI